MSRTRQASDAFSEEGDRQMLESGSEAVTARALEVESQRPHAPATVIGSGLEE